MKSIETLVDDIQGLLSDKGWTPHEAAVRAFGGVLSGRIATKLTEEYVPRLRLSALGKPDRQLWYEVNRQELKEPLPASARMKFLFGDILEETLLWLAKEAGHTVEREQETVEIDGVLGHIDAIVDGELVDVKSSSSFGMAKFRDHALEKDDPFGYLSQLRAYMASLDLKRGHFLAVDKTLGHIVLDTYEQNDTDFSKVIERKKRVLQSENPPGRCYPPEPMGKSGNEKLSTPCSYCGFRKSCWPGLRTFLYSSGPVHLTHVSELPRVPEVTNKQ